MVADKFAKCLDNSSWIINIMSNDFNFLKKVERSPNKWLINILRNNSPKVS